MIINSTNIDIKFDNRHYTTYLKLPVGLSKAIFGALIALVVCKLN